MQNLTPTLFYKTLACSALACLTFVKSAEAQVRYQVVVPEVLGNPVNQTNSRGNEINGNGETLLNRIATFAVWKDGAISHMVNGLTDYPAILSRIGASSINDYQQAVGSKTYLLQTEDGYEFDTFPFYWDPSNGFVDLEDLGSRSAKGVGSTSLYGINRNGQAIGTTETFEGDTKTGTTGFIWSFEDDKTSITALNSFDGYSVTIPQAIDANGTVVGTYRYFLESKDAYREKAFIFDSQRSSRDLAELDSDFFDAFHYTARDINGRSNIVGERDRNAYFYDIANGTGHTIAAPDDGKGLTKAFSLNDNDVVAGVTEDFSEAGQLGLSPILWTRSTGTINLLPQIESSLSKILPAGIDAREVRITPKAINSSAQISARLETNEAFSREVILEPVLDLQWNEMTATARNGVRGVLYTHYRSNDTENIPASALGLEIGFECSSDMQTWHPFNTDVDGVSVHEDEISIELFVPLADCLFVRPVLNLAKDTQKQSLI